jgi:cytochrome c oxidase cbb3-type subunit 4
MEWLQDFGLWMRQFWVVWLMIIFLGIVVWVLWPRGKGKDLERHGRIPLDEDDERGARDENTRREARGENKER